MARYNPRAKHAASAQWRKSPAAQTLAILATLKKSAQPHSGKCYKAMSILPPVIIPYVGYRYYCADCLAPIEVTI